MPLTSHVVAVTGASSGIGRATAELLARKGATVALFARRAQTLDEVADGIRANGGNALAVPGDVTREGDVRAFMALTVARFGRLDVVICNAGIGYHGALDDTPLDATKRLVETNLMGTLYAARAALEIFRRQGSGHIIAVSSIVGRRGMPGAGVYAATKAAQAGLIESLRAEFVGTGLRASIIYPVSVDSEFRAAQERDFGRRVAGVGPRQSPERVARSIVKCVTSQAPEVYPYRLSRALAILNAFAPATADRLSKRFGRRVTPIDGARDAGSS